MRAHACAGACYSSSCMVLSSEMHLEQSETVMVGLLHADKQSLYELSERRAPALTDQRLLSYDLAEERLQPRE